MGKAAIVKKGSKVFFFAVSNEKAIAVVREVLSKIKPKLPCRIKALYQSNKSPRIVPIAQ